MFELPSLETLTIISMILFLTLGYLKNQPALKIGGGFSTLFLAITVYNYSWGLTIVLFVSAVLIFMDAVGFNFNE